MLISSRREHVLGVFDKTMRNEFEYGIKVDIKVGFGCDVKLKLELLRFGSG